MLESLHVGVGCGGCFATPTFGASRVAIVKERSLEHAYRHIAFDGRLQGRDNLS